MRVKERDDTFMVTKGVDDTLRFPHTRTNNPLDITIFKFDYLTPNERDVVKLLDEFMSSCTMVILDRGMTTR